MPELPALLITCEHGGNRIPEPYRPLFEGREDLLSSHRGYDIGALELARGLAEEFDAPLLYSETSRLVVDLNRSPDHRKLFSEITASLPSGDILEILERHYQPHRVAVARAAAGLIRRHGRLAHVAVHSFTPVLDGKTRNADLGLLYDPSRPGELSFAKAWQASLASLAPEMAVRRNYPYRGASDGLTKALRADNPDPTYIGLELEANQRLHADPAAWERLGAVLAASLRLALEEIADG